MKAFGYLAAAAVASIVAMAPTAAHASASDDIEDAALAIIAGGTSPGNGGAFVTASYKRAFTYTNAQITWLFGSSSVSAAGWFDAIAAGTYFDEITDIADVAPGQIFVIDQVFDDPATTTVNETYSGHAAVVVGYPIDITPPSGFYQPYKTGTKQWALQIADSTSSVHGANPTYPDVRPALSKPGTGYIRLYSDATTGDLVAYTWSVTSTTNEDNYYTQSERPFSFGFTPVKPL
jgi:hypothetical protein